MTSSADVALRAGVSRSTVSQILNGREHLFTEETVARVRETAQSMGYRPSLAGRTLARGRSDIVITLIPDITFGPPVREFVDLLTEGLAKVGLTNLLRLSSSEQTLQDAIVGLRPHAIVAMAHLSPEEASRLTDQGIQVIGQSQAVQIAADKAIGRLQAGHLQAQGYSRIVAVRPRSKREQINAPHREAGVLEYCRLHNLDVLPTLEIDLSSEEAVKAVRSLPSGRVGLACYNDEVALAMMGACRHLGLSVPGAVGVIGVDNSVIARASTPTITSVNMNLELNVRELISHIVSGQDLQVPDGAMDEYLRGLEIVPGETTGS
ncbi:LacI family DNA-binding transcriptional regulator [Paenarthrobacter aromaticivorans]|uniref:LacI family DNA-binding transcriptional regulator n=1 Tax=Paenarthrobacter aromaticivorans TaxID=2849150 RepID=UPI003A80FE97